MSACELDGSVRVVVERTRYSTVWRCPWCGEVSIEEFEPTPQGDLQREWSRPWPSE